MSLFFWILAVCLILQTSCGHLNEITYLTSIANYTADAEDTLVDSDTRYKEAGHTGQYLFRTDDAHQYAATIAHHLDDSLVNSNLSVTLNFWAKSTNPIKGDGFAVSLQDNENIVLWKIIDLSVYTAKPNQWVNIIDSVEFYPYQLNKTGMFFKFFAFNANKKATMDIDDIHITIKKIDKIIE